MKYLVKGIIAKHRPAPLPAMIATLTAGLEYVAIDVNDTRALVAPIEGRLGRRMSDVVPAVLMEAFDRKLCAARKSRRPQVFPYQGPSGYHWNVRILMPTPDIIVTNVTEDRRTAAADRRRTPPPYTELEST